MKNPENTIFFVHLPSCGGTTVWEILRQVYEPANVQHLPARPEDLEKYSHMLESNPEFFERTVIGGHMGISYAHTRFPARRIITFIRHPVERAISLYHRRIRNGKWRPSPELGERDILRFYEESNSRGTKYFWPANGGEEASVDDIKRMMDNHLFVVGLAEEFNLSLFLLSHELGWGEVPTYDRRNIGGTRPQHLSPMIAEELSAILAREREIYEHGAAMFTTACRKLPSSVAQTQLPAYEAALAQREAALLAEHAGQSPFVKMGKHRE